MNNLNAGETVRVHYTGKLENGEVFDTSKDRLPLEFIVGSGEVIPGFEKGVIDMQVGETKNIAILPEDAYGPRQEELVVVLPRNKLPEHITPVLGIPLQISHQNGDIMTVIIAELTENTVTLDANHPLAGQTLLFEIELVEIV